MQKTFNLPVIIVVIVALVVGLLYFQNRKLSNKYERVLQATEIALSSKSDSLVNTQIELNGIKNTVVEQSQIILSKKEAERLALLDRDKYKALHLKEVSNNIKLKAEIKILKETPIPEAEIIYVTDSTRALKLPYK